MPLSLDNKLSSTVLLFILSIKDEISFAYHLDICVSMSTGSLILYQWMITIYPEIADSYKQYDDKNLFQKIALDYTISTSKTVKDTSSLSAVVSCKTRYININGNKIALSIGLGEGLFA